jgi:peptide/nickel transport system permease protein
VGSRRYVLSKVVQSLLTLAFVLVFNFFLFRILPGDPAKLLARSRRLPADAVRKLEEQFGLSQGLGAQFVKYVRETFSGNLGISFQYRRPVTTLIWERLPYTLLLVGTATVICTIIGLWIGIVGGWRRGSKFDVSTLGVSLVTYSMPEFWLGMILLIVFSTWLGLFPTGGIVDPNADYTGIQHALDVARHMFLPGLTIILAFLGEYSLIMRSTLLDVMGEDYLTTARAKGLRDVLVRRRHAVPNAMLPVVTLVALNLGFVVSGVVTIEYVFSWPGLGLLEVEALRAPDYPLLQGLFLLFSVAVIVANLIADLLYGYLDPRVRVAT